MDNSKVMDFARRSNMKRLIATTINLIFSTNSAVHQGLACGFGLTRIDGKRYSNIWGIKQKN